MGVSAFSSENPSMVASMIDSMAVNPLQFRPGGGGGSVPPVFNPNDRQDRYWSNMGLEQQPHSNGVPAGREALGLGLAMGMGMGGGMGMAAMSATLGMGMVQQHDHQGSVNYGLRSQAGDKRDLMGWSMIGEGVGGVVGVESLAIRNDHHSFFNTSLAPQPTLLNVNSETTEEKDAKNENNGVSDGNENLVSRSEAVVAGRWDFEGEGDQIQQQSTCNHNTEQYVDPQQQQQQSTDNKAEHADGDQEKLGGGRVMSVEDSEGQSMDERWSAWEEEKSGMLHHAVYFYRECQRNTAAEKGCTVLDGCCEFMPASSEEEGKPNSLLCAACNCHRSFHRRVLCDRDGFQIDNRGQEQEGVRATQDCIAAIKNVANEVTLSVNQAVDQLIQQDFKAGDQFTHPQFDQTFNPASFLKCLDNLRKAAKSMLVTADCLTTLQSKAISSSAAAAAAAAAPHSAAIKDGGNSDCSSSLLNQFRNGKQHHQHLLSGGVNNGGAPPLPLSDSAFNERKEKRKRTRFSTEQITKLNDFAMEVGWTLAGLSKEDIDAVCENVGIEPTTLKYWLYNTRQKSKRRHQEDEISQPIS